MTVCMELCILIRYGKTTENDCIDRAGWMGIPR